MHDDSALLEAFRSGDESAFTILAERYYSAIRAACQRQAPISEVDDCVQAVFLVLARRPGAAARSPALLAWLHQVSAYVCRDARRAAASRKRLLSSISEPPVVGHEPEPALLEQLDAALLELSHSQHAAVLLHATGQSHSEIAKSLGVSSINASKLVQRGLTTLRNRLSRSSTPVSSLVILGLLIPQEAHADTHLVPTTHSLSIAPPSVVSLAKGTAMHLTLTATSTWLIAASLFLTAGVSGIIAADAFDPQTHPSAIDTTVPEKPATPSASSTSDNPSAPSLSEPLARPISIDFDKVSIAECINYIRQTTGLAIIFHPEVARQLDQQTVTVHATDVPVGEILSRIFRALNARYEEVDDAIFITQSPEMDKGRFEETERLIKLALETAVDTQMNQKLIASLNQKTSIYFTGLNLYDTADILTAFGIPVQLDPRIEMHIIPAVDLGISGVKFRYFINHVMRMLHLRYELRDGTLHILMTDTAEALYPLTPVEPEPRVNHRFDRMGIRQAANWIGFLTGRTIRIDDSLKETELSVDFVDAPLSQVVDVLARELNADVVPWRYIHYKLVPKQETQNEPKP